MTISNPVTQRRAGILLHPSSLPGSFGIGDFGPEAERFLDWCVEAGQSVWQILPLGPTGYGNSPYGCLSAFAGNPLLISPELLADDGLVSGGGLISRPGVSEGRVTFDQVREWKGPLLRASWEQFKVAANPDLQEAHQKFLSDAGPAGWLDDWALFSTLKERHGGKTWLSWRREEVKRERGALARLRAEAADEIAFHKYVQFLFDRQWQGLREKAGSRGIQVLGDVPIYVALESADVWANSRLFLLRENFEPAVVSGVPPDYFSATGQLWGNPLYDWEAMARDGYAWWIERMRWNLQNADLVRLDHFRAFAAYWEIPAGDPTAVNGRWMKGPGIGLFEKLRAALGDLPLIAEDLGVITRDVDELREAAGLPGMKVLQFAFSEIDSPHLPHRFSRDTVVYTGTHDNDTTPGWFQSAPPADRARALDYFGCSQPEEIAWSFIRAAYNSVAALAIVPMQDIAEAGSEARMNTPGNSSSNWEWRLLAGQLSADRAGALRRLVELSGRLVNRG